MTGTPASLTLRLLTMPGMTARLGLERVLTFAGIRTAYKQRRSEGARARVAALAERRASLPKKSRAKKQPQGAT